MHKIFRCCVISKRLSILIGNRASNQKFSFNQAKNATIYFGVIPFNLYLNYGLILLKSILNGFYFFFIRCLFASIRTPSYLSLLNLSNVSTLVFLFLATDQRTYQSLSLLNLSNVSVLVFPFPATPLRTK